MFCSHVFFSSLFLDSPRSLVPVFLTRFISVYRPIISSLPSRNLTTVSLYASSPFSSSCSPVAIRLLATFNCVPPCLPYHIYLCFPFPFLGPFVVSFHYAYYSPYCTVNRNFLTEMTMVPFGGATLLSLARYLAMHVISAHHVLVGPLLSFIPLNCERRLLCYHHPPSGYASRPLLNPHLIFIF